MRLKTFGEAALHDLGTKTSNRMQSSCEVHSARNSIPDQPVAHQASCMSMPDLTTPHGFSLAILHPHFADGSLSGPAGCVIFLARFALLQFAPCSNMMIFASSTSIFSSSGRFFFASVKLSPTTPHPLGSVIRDVNVGKIHVRPLHATAAVGGHGRRSCRPHGKLTGCLALILLSGACVDGNAARRLRA